MTARRVDRAPGPATVRRVLGLASRAPSVHNTQPWLWRIRGNRVDLYADPTRRLELADASGRNLVISCGAVLHHVQFAAHALGLATEVTRLPSPREPLHLASVELLPGLPSPHAGSALEAMDRRRTDRRRFTSWPVADERLFDLAAAGSAGGVRVVAVVDVADRFRLELLVGRAMRFQAADGRYVAEQRQWVDHSPADGIPAGALDGSVLDPPALPTRFSPREADPEELVQGSDGLLVLGTEGDDQEAWLRAGEALSALWLQATADGLSVVPLSQVIEVEETRAALQHDLLDGLVTPQILLRIGWQQIGRGDQPRTARRPLDDQLLH